MQSSKAIKETQKRIVAFQRLTKKFHQKQKNLLQNQNAKGKFNPSKAETLPTIALGR